MLKGFYSSLGEKFGQKYIFQENNYLSLSDMPEKNLAAILLKQQKSMYKLLKDMEVLQSISSNPQEWSDKLKQIVHKILAWEEKTKNQVQISLENLRELKTLLPKLHVGPLMQNFENIRHGLEKEIVILGNLARMDCIPFAELTSAALVKCQHKFGEYRNEIKALRPAIQDSLQCWENELCQNITFPLDKSPLTAEYGNKHARLLEQAAIFSKIGLPGVEVPVPQALSSSSILHFLKKHAPGIDTTWCELNEGFKNSLGAKKIDESNFLEQTEVKNKLKQLRSSIILAFEQAAKEDIIRSDLQISNEMVEWLQQLHSRGCYLMSRSTGAEDSREAANAGGNLSVAYVQPDLAEVCRASGKVVASYFTEGSLQNRVNTNENPFETPLCLSVTHQELIGEKLGGEDRPQNIPISLVLFSNEPNYTGTESFRVMRISATRGHGEGVVGMAGIKSDTYWILRSIKYPERLYILADNQYKPHRLAPIRNPTTGNISLQKIANPLEIAESPSLDDQLLKRLFYLGVSIEKIYQNQPMDMELVIKNGIIYPVQARPIHRPASHPTYLDWKKVNKLPAGCVVEKIQAAPFLPGLAEAQIIFSSLEILLTEDLGTAEKQFKKSAHKLVIVRTEEPANSHPVVNFSGMGIPVLYSEKSEAVRALLEQIQEKNVLVACVQTGYLLLLKGTDVEPATCISPGYTVHPAKMAISVKSPRLPASFQESAQISQEIKALLIQASALESHKISLAAIKRLKNQVFLDLKEKQKTLTTKLAKFSDLSNEHRAKTLLQAVEKFQSIQAKAFSETKAALKTGRGEHLHPLFHIKAIEVLLQQEEATGALGRVSLVNLEPQIAAVEKMLAYRESLGFPALFSEEVLDTAAAMTPEQEKTWLQFLKNTECAYRDGKVSKNAVDQFKNMLDTLRKMDRLPFWMMRFFLPEATKSLNAEDLMQSLVENFTLETKNALERLQNTLEEIQSGQANIEAFADPAQFSKAWDHAQTICRQFQFSHYIKPERLQAASSLERISTYQVMNQFIAFFDSAIKRMKGSTSFDEAKKIGLFHSMLLVYFRLLEDWAENLAGPLFTYNESYPLDVYLDLLWDQFMQTKNIDDELKPSAGFSVAAGVLGNATNFDRSLPKTKEDVFTLTHQNLLACMQVLVGVEMKNKVALPSLLEQAISHIEAIRLPVQLVGYSFSVHQTILHYNYPLSNHSAAFQLQFDKKRQTCTLEVSFLGEARQRWKYIKNILQTFHNQKIISFVHPPKLELMLLEFTLHLQAHEMSLVFKLLHYFAKYSMSPSNFEEFIEILTTLEPELRDRVRREVFPELLLQDGMLLKYATEFQNDKKMVLLAVNQNGRALSAAHPELQKDKKVALKAIEQHAGAIEYVHPDLKYDEEIVYATIKQNGERLMYCPSIIKRNKQIVLAAVSINAYALQFADPDLQNDKEVVLKALQGNGTVIRFAHPDLKKDRDVALAAVTRYGHALQWVDPIFREDESLVLAAVNSTGTALQYAHPDLQKNKTIILAAVKNDFSAFGYIHPDLQKDEKLAFDAVKESNCPYLGYLALEMRNNKTIVLEAVAKYGNALQFASSELKNDREVVLAAVKNYGHALWYAHKNFTKDREIVLEAAKNSNPHMVFLDSVDPHFLDDKEIVLAAVKRNGRNYKYANPNLKRDEEIVAAARAQDPRAVSLKIKRKFPF